MTKNYSPIIMGAVACVIVGVFAFYSGMQFQMHRRGQAFNRQGGPAGAQGNRTFGGAGRAGGLQGMRPVSGEILSEDEKSMTIKQMDGSTKIVILSDQTKINKSTEGAKTDLTTSAQITVFGSENSDGSVTAQTISIGTRQATPSATVTK